MPAPPNTHSSTTDPTFAMWSLVQIFVLLQLGSICSCASENLQSVMLNQDLDSATQAEVFHQLEDAWLAALSSWSVATLATSEYPLILLVVRIYADHISSHTSSDGLPWGVAIRDHTVNTSVQSTNIYLPGKKEIWMLKVAMYQGQETFFRYQLDESRLDHPQAYCHSSIDDVLPQGPLITSSGVTFSWYKQCGRVSLHRSLPSVHATDDIRFFLWL
jgi:hypothetical protein